MSKLWIFRNCRTIFNVHERMLPIAPESAAQILNSLASVDDRLWPTEFWPPMVLDRGLQLGAQGGHSQIRYHVAEYVPGKRIEFAFDPMVQLSTFRGRHYFEVIARPRGTVLRHTIDCEIGHRQWIYWKIFIERIHDAVIEDAFDKAEREAGLAQPHRSRWSLYVRLLRWLRARQSRR